MISNPPPLCWYCAKILLLVSDGLIALRKLCAAWLMRQTTSDLHGDQDWWIFIGTLHVKKVLYFFRHIHVYTWYAIINEGTTYQFEKLVLPPWYSNIWKVVPADLRCWWLFLVCCIINTAWQLWWAMVSTPNSNKNRMQVGYPDCRLHNKMAMTHHCKCLL